MIAASDADIASAAIHAPVRAFRLSVATPPRHSIEFSSCIGSFKMSLPEYKQIVDEAKTHIQEIRPADLKCMIDAGEEFSLIDVREPDEVAKGTIPGAVTLSRGILERDIDKVTSDKERRLVLY
jgi:hypothetical protein